MPRINITDLPWPLPRFTPDFRYQHRDGKIHQETAAKAEAEDAERARLTMIAAARAKNPVNAEAARRLARKLDYASRRDDPPESCAASGYMRDQCIKIAGAMWKLAEEVGGLASTSGMGKGQPLIRMASIMRRDWELSMDDFRRKDPAWFVQRLRADLYRCGAATSGGAIIGGLHGEYAPHHDTMRVHGHFIVFGEMARVVHRLRKLSGYAPIVRHWDKPRSTPGIWMTKKPLHSLPAPFTYVIQRFWPSRWEGLIDGKFERGRKVRLPWREHVQLLLWLDRWHLKGLVLMVGMRATPRGLELTRPLYTKESVNLPKKQRQAA
jgi:hypothetical protein